jgi:hypothetical protein
MTSSKVQPFLLGYATALTTALAVALTSGFASQAKMAVDEIDVHRVNVTEPDGTLRMVIASHARLPGVLVRGKEQPLERPQAGMLFLNDEGSEIGGLIFGGRRNGEGRVVDSGGSLSFDRYEANQVVQLLGVDDSEDRMAGLAVSDSQPGGDGHRRIWVGRGDDGAAVVALMDAAGRKRLVMQVAADGTPSLSLLDANGKAADWPPARYRARRRSARTPPHRAR